MAVQQGQAPPKGQQGKQAAPPPQPFPVGVYETTTPDIDVTLTQTAAAQKLGTFKISPNGWLAGIYCLFEMTISTNATNSVSYSKDNPFSVIQKVTFRDIGNREVFGPLTGYEWFTVNKWGGYFGGSNGSDPRNPAGSFTAVTGTGGTGGTFSFCLWLPLELVHRDALGPIENKSSSSAYQLEIYIDSQANTYNQVPSVFGSFRMRANVDGYTEPESADSYGRPLSQVPPANGAVQYWTSEVNQSTPVGLWKYNVQNGIAYSLRNLITVAYDHTSGTRATVGLVGGNFPDPVTLSFGKVQLLQMPLRMYQDKVARWYELEATGPDAYISMENGVWPLPWNRDFINTPGDELRNRLLVTKAGNVLQQSGTGVSSSMDVHYLVNYIVPPGNDAARLRSR